jgi:hypothetical protein
MSLISCDGPIRTKNDHEQIHGQQRRILSRAQIYSPTHKELILALYPVERHLDNAILKTCQLGRFKAMTKFLPRLQW